MAQGIQSDSAEKQRSFRDFWGRPKWRTHAEMWPEMVPLRRLISPGREVRDRLLYNMGNVPQTRRPHPRYRKPRLTIAQILAWADDYKRRTGRWPRHSSGRIRPHDETWLAINVALGRANRGLPGGSSLANLLLLHRGVRNPRNLPALNAREIVRWAWAHLKITGKWPQLHSGAIRDAPGETWYAIDFALRHGRRGFSGHSSLAELLAARGIKRNPKHLPPLTVKQILRWADAFFKRRGHWPLRHSGPIAESPGESWIAVSTALRHGRRGLKGKSSLAVLLHKHRGVFRGKTRGSQEDSSKMR
jgi:hypothetical protein